MALTVSLDIDGVLCQDEFICGGDRHPPPLPGAVLMVSYLINQGVFIFYHTARPEVDRMKTATWLKDCGFPVAPLFMGKPQADIYVDDRGVSSLEEALRRVEDA